MKITLKRALKLRKEIENAKAYAMPTFTDQIKSKMGYYN